MRTSDDHQHHHVAGRDGGARYDGFSGFVILRLSRDLDAGDGPDLREHAKERRLSSLVDYLDEIGQPRTRRVIASVTPQELLELEARAMDGPLPPLVSLTRYWRVDTRGLEQSLGEIVERLTRLDSVELAYAELVVSDPAVGTARNPCNGKQRYLNAEPTGIDARWAWTQPGGKGEHVGLVDVERGWRLRHEDLLGNGPALIHIPLHINPLGSHGDELINEDDGTGIYVGHHGTAVMGVIGAVDNKIGVIGIAPSLRSLRAASIFDGLDSLHVADAVTGALPSMQAGDVLLVEAQRGLTQSELPTETDNADFLAIRVAASIGIVVVAPAGNGATNLDDWEDVTTGRRLGVPKHPEWDSGAIMVGGCQSTPVGKISHTRTATSNYGRRVNSFAWGQWVMTCGGTDAAPDTSYTPIFGGTSSAAAIVAGAAVLAQSMHLERRPNQPLSSRRMRSILADPATGTPRNQKSPHGIGSMPNLKLIKTQVLDRL